MSDATVTAGIVVAVGVILYIAYTRAVGTVIAGAKAGAKEQVKIEVANRIDAAGGLWFAVKKALG